MMKFLCAAALALLSFSALAQECPITTNTNSILRQAPGPSFAQIGTVPAGTAVPVDVCFDRGAFCSVTTSAGPGFISGDLLAVPNGTTLHTLETARWARIDAGEAPGPAAYDRCNIVVWGDELATNGFGPDLSRLLARSVSMQGVAGEDGKAIAARMSAGTHYDGRIAVIWNRRSEGETAEQYMADLATMTDSAREKASAFVVISDVVDLDGSATLTAAADQAATDAINEAIGTRYPQNFLDVRAVLADPATRSDGLQLSPAGKAAVAGALASFIRQNGW